MGILGAERVVGSVHVGGDGADEGGAVLAAIGVAESHPGELRERVGPARRLEGPGEQRVDGHRLGGVARIGAGGAQVEELPHAVAMRGVQHVAGNEQVLLHERRRATLVRGDAARRAGRDHDQLRARAPEEAVDGPPVEEVGLGADDEPRALLAREPPPERGADEGLPAGDPDASGTGHAGGAATRSGAVTRPASSCFE